MLKRVRFMESARNCTATGRGRKQGSVFSAVSVRDGLSAAAAAVFYIIDPFAGGIVSRFKDDCRGRKLASKASQIVVCEGLV